MAPSKLRKAIGAVKDQTSISIANVSNSTSISDLDVAIVKATRHDEYPAEEKHVQEILSLTCYSRTHISQCVSTLSRRLGKTHSWTVALKTLILVHRLLSEGDPAYEQEIFFATRRGTRMLNLANFRDSSRSDAWDFSAFVRTYGRYLDEMLEYRMNGKRGRRRSRSQQLHEEMMMDEEEKGLATLKKAQPTTPVREMRTERIFTKAQHLQQLLDRVLACRPTGPARHDRIVAVALYQVVKESFQLYYDLQEVMSVFVDRFMELEVPDCVRIFDIFTRLSKQFDDLDRFYSWCKSSGISRSSEFPDVERVTQQKLDVMDEFIRDKSILAHNKKPAAIKSLEQLTSEEDAQRASASAATQVRALPAPKPAPVEEEPKEEVQEAQEEEEVVQKEEESLAIVKMDEEADFLNLRDGSVTLDDHADKFALALFDGHPAAETTAPALTWEAFADEADWETALLQSASNLSGQRATLGGGFDMLLLDGMYSQPQQATTLGFSDGSGSASSVALPKAATTPLLALPAPPTAGGGAAAPAGSDPFAASLSVPAPSYVQMTDLERKRRLLMEEQAMWQQYARDGMQGQVTMAKLNGMGGAGYVQRF